MMAPVRQLYGLQFPIGHIDDDFFQHFYIKTLDLFFHQFVNPEARHAVFYHARQCFATDGRLLASRCGASFRRILTRPAVFVSNNNCSRFCHGCGLRFGAFLQTVRQHPETSPASIRCVLRVYAAPAARRLPPCESEVPGLLLWSTCVFSLVTGLSRSVTFVCRVSTAPRRFFQQNCAFPTPIRDIGFRDPASAPSGAKSAAAAMRSAVSVRQPGRSLSCGRRAAGVLADNQFFSFIISRRPSKSVRFSSVCPSFRQKARKASAVVIRVPSATVGKQRLQPVDHRLCPAFVAHFAADTFLPGFSPFGHPPSRTSGFSPESGPAKATEAGVISRRCANTADGGVFVVFACRKLRWPFPCGPVH